MRIANIQVRREPYYRRAAIEQGLQRLGYTLTTDRAPAKREDILCLWNKKRGAEESMANLWERQGGTVIVMENGYLQAVDKTYYAISVHGHNGSGWFPVGIENRFAKLGFEIKPMVLRDGPIVVRAQRGIGSALMASPPGWAEKLAANLKANGLPVRLAPHPGDKGKLEKDLAALKGASLLHIWSSAMGVRALVEGIPVQHHAPHWICGLGHQTREDKLRFMAHGQWHHEEIATGEPFARILDNLESVKWA